MVIGETMSLLLKSWGCDKAVCEVDGTTILFVVVLVLPLCLFRQFGHLALVSVFSITTIRCVCVSLSLSLCVFFSHAHSHKPLTHTHAHYLLPSTPAPLVWCWD